MDENLRFSQRIGKQPKTKPIQLESMDKDLQVSLWNVCIICFLDYAKKEYYVKDDHNGILLKFLWINFFNYDFDDFGEIAKFVINDIKKWFFQASWYHIYDFLEAVVAVPANCSGNLNKESFKDICNRKLIEANAGYRFVGDIIVPITNEQELAEVEEALDKSSQAGLEGVNIHLKTAIHKLSDRDKPDYRNSIKESISAVESIVRIIADDHKTELGKALNIIDAKFGIDGGLKSGFKSIYGYTSGPDGIRHAMLEKPSIEYADAKLMLIMCSAFVNYLIEKYLKK